MSRNEEIVTALTTALERGEIDAFVSLLAPGSITWHNYDRLEVDSKRNMEGVAQLQRLVDGLQLEIVGRQDTAGGFTLQFVMRGTIRSSGASLEAHNCIVMRVEGGLVARLDEYVDPALLSAFA